MNYRWNWNVFLEYEPGGIGTYLDLLVHGLGWTVATSLAGACLALVLGIALGIARTLPGKWLRGFTTCYIELFRNVPFLVQLFLWYYVLPELLPEPIGAWLKQLEYGSFWTAVVGLGFFHAVRVCLMLAAGIQAQQRGQRQACLALGMTTWQSYRHVLLPVAFRHALPPLSSECLNVVKNSAVALTIGLMELTAATRSMSEFTFQIFEAFTVATISYLALNMLLLHGMQRLERRFSLRK